MKLVKEISGVEIHFPKHITDYFLQYSSEINPQPAYLLAYLRNEKAELYADCNAEIGNSIPSNVFYGYAEIFRFPAAIKVTAVRRLMAAVAPKIAALHESYSERWNGNNYVGSCDQNLVYDIEDFVGGFFYDEDYDLRYYNRYY